jgi:hypothetical protein
MKERQILFSGPMVRAILEGRKTQTRRVVKPQPIISAGINEREINEAWQNGFIDVKCPYGAPGDHLWVRETWFCGMMASEVNIFYAANDEGYSIELSEFDEDELAQVKRWSEKNNVWNPSIHMPRWASRIQLEVTRIRVERLQEISQNDAIAEGVKITKYGCYKHNYPHPCLNAVDGYRELWEFINGPGSWDANPWVWVVEFKVLMP